MPKMTSLNWDRVLEQWPRGAALRALVRGDYGAINMRAGVTIGKQVTDFLTDARWAARTGRVVDIGTMSYADSRRSAETGYTMLGSGHIRHPFDHVWIILGETTFNRKTTKPQSTLVIARPGADHPHSMEFAEGTIADGNVMIWYLAKMDAGRRLEVLYDSHDPEMRELTSEVMGYEQAMQQYAVGINTVLAAVAVCNTRGIAFNRIRPERGTKRPRKAGYIRFHTGPYFTALNAPVRERQSAGTHASPKPHIRRGHVRTLHSGQQVWIREQLIGVRSEHELAFVETRRAYVRKETA